MFYTVFSSLLLFSCVQGMFLDQYLRLAKEWGVYIPPYTEKMEEKADALAVLYTQEPLSNWIPLKYAIQIDEEEGCLHMVKLVNKSSRASAVEEFTEWVKARSILGSQIVHVTNLYQPKEVTAQEALKYTNCGGISSQKLSNNDDQFLVVACFEFGYASEYSELARVFGGNFPQYDLNVELLARAVAASRTLTPIGQFKGMMSRTGGYSILLIRGLTVKGATARDAVYWCVNALNSKEAWNGLDLVATEELKSFGTFDKISDLLESTLPMTGGISATTVELNAEEKAALCTDISIAHSVCAYFKLRPTQQLKGHSRN